MYVDVAASALQIKLYDSMQEHRTFYKMVTENIRVFPFPVLRLGKLI